MTSVIIVNPKELHLYRDLRDNVVTTSIDVKRAEIPDMYAMSFNFVIYIRCVLIKSVYIKCAL